MRTLLRILALVPLVLPSVGPATTGAATIGGTPSDVVSTMAGHWRCTSSDGSVSRRTYVVTDGGPVMSGVSGSATTRAAGGIRSSVNTPGIGTASIARTVYGRQDGSDAGPFFERIVELSDRTLSVQAREGSAAGATSGASSLRFTGRSAASRAVDVSEEPAGARATAMRVAPNAQPLSLSYTLEANGLRRIARLGTETLSDDRCNRDTQVASAVCSSANAPAATLHAVQPMALAGSPQGLVQLRVVLDDRGRVVGEDVLSSSSAALTASAIAAARDSTFTAAVQNCRAVSSQNTFAVRFGTDAHRASNNGRETNL